MKFKNLLVSGCSFTQDGIGGCPPTVDSAGGCSFIDNGSGSATQPRSWAGFLARKLKVTSLVNTAASGHGNILVANSILDCINQFLYTPNETLVIVNLSEPWRFDLPCPYDHVDADHANIPWNQSLIACSYLYRSSKTMVQLEKNIGFDQIEYFTSNAIEFLFNFLENQKIKFYFLTMNDFSQTRLQKVIDKFDSRHIHLTPGKSMIEYCQITDNFMASNDLHPSTDAHEKISDQVYDYIVSNEI
jgi:hypothetical protein